MVDHLDGEGDARGNRGRVRVLGLDARKHGECTFRVLGVDGREALKARSKYEHSLREEQRVHAGGHVRVADGALGQVGKLRDGLGEVGVKGVHVGADFGAPLCAEAAQSAQLGLRGEVEDLHVKRGCAGRWFLGLRFEGHRRWRRRIGRRRRRRAWERRRGRRRRGRRRRGRRRRGRGRDDDCVAWAARVAGHRGVEEAVKAVGNVKQARDAWQRLQGRGADGRRRIGARLRSGSAVVEHWPVPLRARQPSNGRWRRRRGRRRGRVGRRGRGRWRRGRGAGARGGGAGGAARARAARAAAARAAERAAGEAVEARAGRRRRRLGNGRQGRRGRRPLEWRHGIGRWHLGRFVASLVALPRRIRRRRRRLDAHVWRRPWRARRRRWRRRRARIHAAADQTRRVVLVLERGHDRCGAQDREHDESEKAARDQNVGKDAVGTAAACAPLCAEFVDHGRSRGIHIVKLLLLAQTFEGEVGKVCGRHVARPPTPPLILRSAWQAKSILF